MVLVDLIIHIGRRDFGPMPTIEVSAQFEESRREFAVVRNAGPLSNKTFESLRSLLHKQKPSQTTSSLS